MSNIDAPSFSLEALAAVTVPYPSFPTKTALNSLTFSLLSFLGSSSSLTSPDLPT
jgi:hypothetical protein